MNEDYSVEELKEKLISDYVKPSVQYFFNCSEVHLGYGKDIIIYDFITAKGKSCKFWEFSKTIRDKAHRLNLFLLTTLKDDGPVSDVLKEKSNKNLPTTDTVFKWASDKPVSNNGFKVTEKKIFSKKENVSPVFKKHSIANLNIMPIGSFKKSNVSSIDNYPSCSSLLMQPSKSQDCYVISSSGSGDLKVNGSGDVKVDGSVDVKVDGSGDVKVDGSDFLKPSDVPSIQKKKLIFYSYISLRSKKKT